MSEKLIYDYNIVQDNRIFKKYNVPFVWDFEDDENNILILPEIILGYAKSTKNIQCVSWWMSVDNFFVNCRISDMLGEKQKVISLSKTLLFQIFLLTVV